MMLRNYLFFVFIWFCTTSMVYGEGHFWHVTDFHVDQNYSRTGDIHDLCHEGGSVSTADNGLYGNFLCDSPQLLVNLSIQSMLKIYPNPDYIIWTGDTMPHTRKFEIMWDVVFEGVRNITLLLKSTFPNTIIIPSIGNHDTSPPNQLLPNGTEVYEGYLEKGGWNKVLPKEALPSFKKGGYFSLLVQPKLRIISLNTILWYSSNVFTEKLSDPLDQFEWLDNILSKSTANDEKVHLIGHVSPGFYNRVKPGTLSDPTYHPQYLKAFLEILKKYSKVILGQMYGHFHFDTFQLFELDTGSFVSSSILAPSVTPWFAPKLDDTSSIPVNPSIRLMKYSLIDKRLLDFEQFYLNLTKANKRSSIFQNDELLFEPLYTFTKFYNVLDMSTQSLVQVYEKLKSDSRMFNSFFKLLTAGKESVSCDEHCKVSQLCSMGCTSIEEYKSCMKSVHISLAEDNRLFESADKTVLFLFLFLLAFFTTCCLVLTILNHVNKNPKNKFHYESFPIDS